MGTFDTVLADTRYGLRLVDKLTGGPLVGTFGVLVVDVDSALVYPTMGSVVAIDRLPSGTATFQVTAAHYVGRTYVAGTDGPSVPASVDAAPLVDLLMNPRTGYPFPPTLTRVVGEVRYQPDMSAPATPASGALVQVFGVYQPVSDPLPPVEQLFETFVTDDGQFTAWFQPVDVGAGYRTMPSDCRVEISFTPPGGGPPIDGDIPATPVVLFRTTSLPKVVLT